MSDYKITILDRETGRTQIVETKHYALLAETSEGILSRIEGRTSRHGVLSMILTLEYAAKSTLEQHMQTHPELPALLEKYRAGGATAIDLSALARMGGGDRG
jgi:hypothetical protein